MVGATSSGFSLLVPNRRKWHDTPVHADELNLKWIHADLLHDDPCFARDANCLLSSCKPNHDAGDQFRWDHVWSYQRSRMVYTQSLDVVDGYPTHSIDYYIHLRFRNYLQHRPHVEPRRLRARDTRINLVSYDATWAKKQLHNISATNMTQLVEKLGTIVRITLETRA
jgi:hypothetical protein